MQNLPKWLVQLIAGTVAVLLIALTISQLYTVSSKFKAVDTQHVINISAEGKVTVKPDLATINIAVTTDGSTAQAAQTSNTEKMNKVLAFLKTQSIGPKDITTSGYNVNPKYDYTKGGQNITGYTAYQNVSVKVRNLDNVGKIVDGATQNGANQINGISYGFDDPDKYREEAREQALQNARQKAESLAQAAGVHLGKLVSFSEQNSGYPVPMLARAVPAMGFGMGSGAESVAPQTEPGVQDITANVTVSYEIY